jgi:NADPH:quinone reductase-like Zn-dependent oxidoreductase
LFLGLIRPSRGIPGVDYSGTVEAVGRSVTRLKPGDEVFGGVPGSLAEYVTVPAERPALKPAGVTFEQAAALPVAGLTALQGLRDTGRLKPGQRVLINGASGGVGSLAVPIARWLGADVTAVCSSRNVEQARSLGADRVIDYTRDDFTRSGERYDLIYDIVGSRSWGEYKRVLDPNGRLVLVGGTRSNRWVGPMGPILKLLLTSLGGRPKLVPMVAKRSPEDLVTLADLVATGNVRPVIEQYPLSQAAEALRYLGEGHARGKIVVTI